MTQTGHQTRRPGVFVSCIAERNVVIRPTPRPSPDLTAVMRFVEQLQICVGPEAKFGRFGNGYDNYFARVAIAKSVFSELSVNAPIIAYGDQLKPPITFAGRFYDQWQEEVQENVATSLFPSVLRVWADAIIFHGGFDKVEDRIGRPSL